MQSDKSKPQDTAKRASAQSQAISAKTEQTVSAPESKEKLTAFAVRGELFQGPFPHPDHAAKYEALCPGFLERSLAMAERAQEANADDNRRKLENERLKIEAKAQRDKEDSQDTKRGQYLGFIALMILTVTAFVLAYLGYEGLAIAIFAGSFVLTVGRLFAGKFYHPRK